MSRALAGFPVRSPRMACVLGALLCALLLPPALAGRAEGAAAGPRPSLPPDENYLYDVDFLFFKNIAEGTLRLRRLGNLSYRAELIAETKGIIGFLTSYRKNHYASDLEYDPARGRFFTRNYTKTVYRGLNISRTTMEIDRQGRTIRWAATSNGGLREKGTEPIPPGVVYEDLLSAFFNFRGGAFGPLSRGRHFTILTLPAYDTPKEERERGESLARDFDIRLADPETERRYRRAYDREKERGLLVLVKVPKELFGQETGEVRVWFDESLIPVSATVEQAIYFGDVHGTLRKAVIGRPRGLPQEGGSR